MNVIICLLSALLWYGVGYMFGHYLKKLLKK